MRRIRKVYLQNAAGDRWGLNGENGVYVSSLAGFGYTLSPTYADLTRGFFLAVSGESEPQGTVPFTVYFTRNAYAVYQSFVDWLAAAGEAMDKEFHGKYDIWGGDVDPRAVAIARDNARKAGVEDVVRFEVADMRNFRREDTYGQLVTNPPYGERLLERQEAEALYRDFGHMWERLPDTWRTLVLSSHTEFERTFGHQAKKKRKLYNGMIKCDLFMYGNV